jgi:hypothetical protein
MAGQGPRVRWEKNPAGAKRTIEEAEAIARKYGVQIPGDVVFFEAEFGELEGHWEDWINGLEMETARASGVSEHHDGYIHWQDHYNRFGAIPFLIHPEVLESDEAIVAVFQHEMFELAELREVFMANKGRMDASDYGRQVSIGRKGNFHDQAWDSADETVLRMREAKK